MADVNLPARAYGPLRLVRESARVAGALVRLDVVRLAIEQGQPLPAHLHEQGLLPLSMAPLLQAAERSRNLVWVLGEMGVALSNRMLRISQRIMLTLFPIVIFAAGAVVGVFAVAMFLPLIELMTRLTEL